MPTLPCEDGGGSLNNPNNPTNPENPVGPYVPPELCVGQLELSSTNPDLCQLLDQQRQESYVAEALNISGAPINIYKLLGVHEQGHGSIVDSGLIIGTTALPGYPLSQINTGTGAWRSAQSGTGVAGSAYVGVDFGIKLIQTGDSEYAPIKQKWTKVGALTITQGNTPNEYARQVKVEITDGAVELGGVSFLGTGDGQLTVNDFGSSASQCTVTAMAASPTSFDVFAAYPNGSVISLGRAFVGTPFKSVVVNFTITAGTIPFTNTDSFFITINYVWKRAGIFNLVQSPLAQTLNLNKELLVKAVRVIPTLFTGAGSWEVSELDVLDSPATNIDNIQDLFFNENRDRDYDKVPLELKVQYSPTDAISDLAKFGINILDQYIFTTSFATMVQRLGRPIVVGDIIEVIPELQWDHNLKPVRKFLEVTDTGWSAEGFSTHWKPTVYRFTAQPALPSQETRDIFGTLDTNKYLIADEVVADDTISKQLDITELTKVEEIAKEAADKVPERGSDAQRTTVGQPLPYPLPPTNPKGQPPGLEKEPSPAGKQNLYIEDGLPRNGEPYGEGFKLPDITTVNDGDYFRLYYPPETRIPPRLYRFSAVKNRWIYMETDRRGEYSSHKPSIQKILQSNTKQGLGKKQT